MKKRVRALMVIILLLSGLYATLLGPASAQNDNPQYVSVVGLATHLEGQHVLIVTRVSTQHDPVSFGGTVISANEAMICVDGAGYGHHCVVTDEILAVTWYP